MQREPMVFLGIGLLFVVLAIPLVQRRIRPNRWYGLRVPATLADEIVWYDANAASGRDLMLFGVVVSLLALILPLVRGMTGATYSLTCAGVLLVGGVVLAVRGIHHADRLLQERRNPGGPERGQN